LNLDFSVGMVAQLSRFVKNDVTGDATSIPVRGLLALLRAETVVRWGGRRVWPVCIFQEAML
jgi:hypothetical protein